MWYSLTYSLTNTGFKYFRFTCFSVMSPSDDLLDSWALGAAVDTIFFVESKEVEVGNKNV